MAGQPTPGPWTVEYRVYLDDAGDPKIAASVISGPYSTIAGIMPVAEYVANAKLIAASHDLLEACQEIVGVVFDGELLRAQEIARAAIAKAGGVPAFVEVTPEEVTADVVALLKRSIS